MKGIVAIVAFFLTVGFLTACEKPESAGVNEAIAVQSNEGPAEKAGDKTDETGKKAEKKIDTD